MTATYTFLEGGDVLTCKVRLVPLHAAVLFQISALCTCQETVYSQLTLSPRPWKSNAVHPYFGKTS